MLCLFLFYLMYVCNAETLKLGAPNRVITFTAKWCDKSCDTWLNWIDNLKKDFPSIYFETYDIDDHFEKASDYNLTEGVFNRFKDDFLSVPISVWLHGDKYYKFNGARTFNGIKTWIKNGLFGQFHPIFVTDNIHELGEWDKRYSSSITVIHNKEPDFGHLLSNIPSLGYAWGVQNHSLSPVIFIRSMLNNVSMAFDFRWENLLSQILAPVIPYWLAVTDIGLESIESLSTNELYIYSNKNLPEWWNDFSNKYPETAFIQFRSNETDDEMSTTILKSRSVIYKKKSIGKDIIPWFENIWKGMEIPFYRKSVQSKSLYDWLPDISGNDLWDWIKNKNVMLYVYGSKQIPECQYLLHDLKNQNTTAILASFNIEKNDHELFLELSRPGFLFYFSKQKLFNVYKCQDKEKILKVINPYNDEL